MMSESSTQTPGALEEGLLAAIAAEPDAIEPRLVYADWLQAEGDPRGELIIVQHERRARPDDEELAARERDLVERAAAALAFPGLRPQVLGRWELGFLDELAMGSRDLDAVRRGAPGWLDRPALRMVRTLDLSLRNTRGFRQLAGGPLGRSVRRLRIGTPSLPFIPSTSAAIARLLPGLRGLALRCDALPPLDPFGALPLDDFELEGVALDAAALARLAQLPAGLGSLELRVQVVRPGALDGLRPVLTGELLPALRRLALPAGFAAADVLEELAASGRAKTLEAVTLDTSMLDDAAVRRLARHRDALATLRIQPVRHRYAVSASTAYQRLGSLLQHHLGRATDAVPLYEEAVKLNPRNDVAQHGLAIALRATRRPEDSRRVLDELLRDRPTAARWFSRHFASSDLRRHAEAVADLEQAVALDATHADAWNALGVERQYTGDAEGAAAAFERALTLRPDHGYALRNRAELLLEQRRDGEALPLLEQELEARPSAWLRLLRGHALLGLERRPEALAAADALLADPERPYRHGALLLRALARIDREPSQAPAPAPRADLAELIRGTLCPGWVALGWLAEGLLEPGRWTRAAPAPAIEPPAISAALAAHARAVRPADATPLHEAEPADHVEAAERAIAGALLDGDRPLALRRMAALHAFLEAEGAPMSHAWPVGTALTFRAIGARLPAADRELLEVTLGAPRGRVPRAALR